MTKIKKKKHCVRKYVEQFELSYFAGENVKMIQLL